MHPYRDPLDTQRKFTKSRIPLPREDADDLQSKPEDFLNPRAMTAPRSTGYNIGHIRSVLQLDTYGPNHSADVEKKRSVGLLPNSPNVDRNRDLRTEVCIASNTRTVAKLRKEKEMKAKEQANRSGSPTSLLADGAESPNLFSINQRPSSPTTNNMSADSSVSSAADYVVEHKHEVAAGAAALTRKYSNDNINKANNKNTSPLYRPGTSPAIGTYVIPKYEDHLMTDSNARRHEWFKNYVNGVTVSIFQLLYGIHFVNMCLCIL